MPQESPAQEFIDHHIVSETTQAGDLTLPHGSNTTSNLVVNSAVVINKLDDVTSVLLIPASPAEIKTIYCKCEPAQKAFAEALKGFEASIKDKDAKLIFTSGKKSWDEIVEDLLAAEQAYKDEAKKSKIRSALHSFQAPDWKSFNGLLNIVPFKDTYGSLIVGGIQTVLTVASTLSKARISVYEKIATIPHELNKCSRLLEINSDMPSLLHEKIVEVYKLIFRILRYILIWLKTKSPNKIFKVILKQEHYGRELRELENEYKIKVKELHDEVEICGQFRARQTQEMGISLVNQLSNLTVTVDKGHHDRDQFNQQMLEQALKIAPLTRLLLEQQTTQSRLLEEQIHLIEDHRRRDEKRMQKRDRHLRYHESMLPFAEMIRDSFKEMCHGQEDLNKYTHQHRVLEHDGTKLYPPRRRSTKPSASHQLLDSLYWIAPVHSADLARSLDMVQRLSRDQNDRAMYILKHARFANWLLTPRSSSLLINAQETEIMSDRATSTSSVMAFLASTMPADQGMKCLYWFASLHTFDEHTTTLNVARSLIYQLLSYSHGADLSFIRHKHIAAMSNSIVQSGSDSSEKLDELLDVLAILIEDFPSDATIFCILDGLAMLEMKPGQKTLIHMLIEGLLELTKMKLHHGIRFKLLVANAGGGFWSRSQFREEEILNVSGTVSGTGATLSPSTWKTVTDNRLRPTQSGRSPKTSSKERRPSVASSRRQSDKDVDGDSDSSEDSDSDSGTSE